MHAGPMACSGVMLPAALLVYQHLTPVDIPPPNLVFTYEFCVGCYDLWGTTSISPMTHQLAVGCCTYRPAPRSSLSTRCPPAPRQRDIPFAAFGTTISSLNSQLLHSATIFKAHLINSQPRTGLSLPAAFGKNGFENPLGLICHTGRGAIANSSSLLNDIAVSD